MSGLTPPHGSPPCARCAAAAGRSCCQVRPGEKLATLTVADVARIQAATGQPQSAFLEREWLSPPDAHQYESFRPAYRGYFAREPVRLTLAVRDGACVFLDPRTGCRLSAEDRPTPCRLYPFEPVGSLELRLLAGPFESEAPCLAVEEACGDGSFEALAARLGTSMPELWSLAERLRVEVREHAQRPSRGLLPGRPRSRP